MFGHDWEDGTATIVDSHIKSTTGDGMVSTREFAADVQTPDGTVFRCVIQEPTIATNFWPPNVGAVVKVHVDVKHQKAKFDKSDPQISAKNRGAQIDASFEQIARGAPAASTAPPEPDFSTPDPARLHMYAGAQVDAADQDAAARLKRLQELKAQGLITEDEYNAKRQAIVDAL